MNERLEFAMEYGKDWRSFLVAEGEHPEAMAPVCIFWRNGEVICMANANQVDRDKGLHTMQIGISGLSADEVVFITDAVGKVMTPEQQAGRRGGFLPHYEQGQFQREFQAGDPTTSECLMLVYMNRKGEADFLQVPYVADYEARTIAFGELDPLFTEQGKEPLQTAGYVPDMLGRFFRDKTMEEILRAELGDEEFERAMAEIPHRQLHQDLGAMKAMMAITGSAVQINKERLSEEELVVMERSFQGEMGKGFSLYDPSDPDNDLFEDEDSL